MFGPVELTGVQLSRISPWPCQFFFAPPQVTYLTPMLSTRLRSVVYFLSTTTLIFLFWFCSCLSSYGGLSNLIG
ncbi:hypothetical protein CROQUDRAFT_494812 [Cronartium quercuum f. sp. fusiforme G11]|uniref:Uncharacterized protein n=1 Tax=Cronartium quercuum f. sp. fusiforme G11 TaxID=708437 RepID=A0A9P6NH97_9BASI|nr:hypothetical protein CROQUDRAFT_494812 [Cronartium quercuum f. sp. fusiforme G11]